MSKPNVWARPSNPPPKLFLGRKELDLVKAINTELEERVIGEQILYYPLSIENSNYNLYGESLTKVYLPPVHVYVLVDFEGSVTEQSLGAVDRLQTLTVYFHSRRLTKEVDLNVSEGDILLYGNSYYEIVELNSKFQIFNYSEADYKMEISAKCNRCREGFFDG